MSKKTSLTWLHWFDRWGLFTIVAFLLAFIPVYPKLPLFDIIPGYIVRVRLEDVFMLLAVCVLILQLYRKKVSVQSPLSGWINWYAVAGMASLVSGMLIVGSIPIELLHVGKSTLHYLRYLEYFALFFLTVGAIRTKFQAQLLTAILVLGLTIVGLYGVGQKYAYWPVYSTMNREFSKGIRLYLTDHARVQSTFGGHYDLAAYLVVVLPIVLVLALSHTHRARKAALWGVFTLGVWLITVSASRTSFAAFAACSMLAIGIVSSKESSWKARCTYAASRGGLVAAIILVLFWSFGDDIRERLLQTAAAYPAVYEPYQQLSGQAEQIAHSIKQLLPQTVVPTAPPENSISTQEIEAMVASDQQPSVIKPGEILKPTDVYTDVPDLVAVATISATGSATYVIVEQPRTYSEAALKHGLSLAIRLDTLWPRALQGFYRDPLFGSGYATLTKDSVYHFTEAESTDNNFLRTLGETGLFGFITFYGAIITSAVLAWKLAWQQLRVGRLKFTAALGIGFVTATIGLLLNALYIDVFASSKVAFIYWAVAGIIVSLWQMNNRKNANTES